jgi:hypothetical protein
VVVNGGAGVFLAVVVGGFVLGVVCFGVVLAAVVVGRQAGLLFDGSALQQFGSLVPGPHFAFVTGGRYVVGGFVILGVVAGLGVVLGGGGLGVVLGGGGLGVVLGGSVKVFSGVG